MLRMHDCVPLINREARIIESKLSVLFSNEILQPRIHIGLKILKKWKNISKGMITRIFKTYII